MSLSFAEAAKLGSNEKFTEQLVHTERRILPQKRYIELLIDENPVVRELQKNGEFWYTVVHNKELKDRPTDDYGFQLFFVVIGGVPNYVDYVEYEREWDQTAIGTPQGPNVSRLPKGINLINTPIAPQSKYQIKKWNHPKEIPALYY